MRYIAVFAYTVSLKQTIPSDGSQVCPGNPLVYQCITSMGKLTWQESGVTETFAIDDKGASIASTGRFHFEVVDVINESIIVSTATIPQARTNDTGIQLSCIQHVQPLTETIAVLGKFVVIKPYSLVY